jgi:hypothetical protein
MNHANASAPPALNGLGVLPWLPNAIIVGVGMAGLLGCEGSQSALDPAGRCCGTNCTPVLENGDRHGAVVACHGRPDPLRDAR